MSSPKKSTNQDIVLGALLHDIGKFYQRASRSGESLNNEYNFYLVNQGNYFSYKHAAYTAKFFDENKNVFNLLENNAEDSYQRIKELAAMHHNTNTIFQKIIQHADNASAGNDRLDDIYNENVQKKNFRNFRKIPLKSIFSLVNFDSDSNHESKIENENKENFDSYCLRHLSYQTVNPKSKINNEIIKDDDYKNLYDQFLNELNGFYTKNANLKINIDYNFFESFLIRLLEKYLWCIPSATNDETNDISLFDHSYTTASIASTLYLYLKEKFNDNWDKTNNEIDVKENFARILKVDISGIQSYIFDIKKTAFSSKLLRSRSFELSAMLKAISQKVKDGLGLDQVSVLFDGGGNLQMLIPNSEEKLNKLKQIQEEIEDTVFENYFGELNFIFSLSDPISLEDFNIKNYCRKVRVDIEKKSEKAKLEKLQRILKEEYKHIFHEPYDTITKDILKTCILCEKRPTNENNLDKSGTASDENAYCSTCQNLIYIGKELTKSDGFILTKKPTRYNFNLLPDVFIEFIEENTVENYFKNKEQDKIYQIYGSGKSVFGLRFSNPYYVPKYENNEEITLTFEEIAGKSNGDKKLAMLKGDVNDLGAIFWFGIRKKVMNNSIEKEDDNILSLSRYSSLSRMFDYFFTEVLVKLIETKDIKYEIFVKDENEKKFVKKNFDFSDRIYVIYSGGDDFTLVGSWDAIIHFAFELHENLKILQEKINLSIFVVQLEYLILKLHLCLWQTPVKRICIL